MCVSKWIGGCVILCLGNVCMEDLDLEYNFELLVDLYLDNWLDYLICYYVIEILSL